jgi:hypothetical protein
VAEDKDSVTLYEGGKFAFVCEDDYIVLDESGCEIECERYGILVTGECKKENKVLKFVKYDN